MSDEKNFQSGVLFTLTILALVFSTIALIMSSYTLSRGASGAPEGPGEEAQHQQQPQKGKVVISKQYDRGRSLAKALATKKPLIVFFYTDWCGYCQRFAPTFDKVTKDSKIKKNFAIAFVNCEQEENKKIMQEYEVRGFPTVYVVDAQGKRTHLENSTFFNDDSKDVIVKNALELIGVK